MLRLPIFAILAVPLASTLRAQTQVATFDSLPEAVIGNSFTEDGLLFADIDSYAGTTILPFAAEDASGDFAGKDGFGPPNVLRFLAPTPGPGVSGFGRFGSFTITPGGIRRGAVVNLILLPSFGSNTITLEGRLGGVVVATDAIPVDFFTPNWAPAVLSISGVDFDQLKLVSAGTGDGGACFVGFDSIVVESAGPGTSYCVATPNSVGPGALISAEGSRSVHANDLVLNAGPVPNQPGLFLYGTAPTQTPFGNGNLCVAGTVQRLAGHVPSGNVLSHAFDADQPASGAPPVLAGQTLHFQAWYRDTAGGGAGFNLSDGLEVTFTP